MNLSKVPPTPGWLIELCSPARKIETISIDRSIPEGQRNDSLTRLAGKMRKAGFSSASIESALIEENKESCDPPLGESEVRQIAKSVSRYSVGPLEVPEQKRQMSFTTLKDFFGQFFEKTKWIVEGMLPEGGLAVLAGKPKAGKSTLVKMLILAVAQGREFLGRKTIQGTVLYLALEEIASELQQSLKDMGATGEEDIRIYCFRAPENAVEQLRSIAMEVKPKLIVIDTLFRFSPAKDANDYAQTSKIFDPLLELARDSKAHLLFLHHMGKGDRQGADAILGSTGIFASVDSAILLTRSDEFSKVQTRQRYGNDLPETVLNFDPVTRSFTLGGTVEASKEDQAKEKILDYLGGCPEPQLEADILDAVEVSKAIFVKILRQLLKDGYITRVGKGGKGDPFRYAVAQAESAEETRGL